MRRRIRRRRRKRRKTGGGGEGGGEEGGGGGEANVISANHNRTAQMYKNKCGEKKLLIL